MRKLWIGLAGFGWLVGSVWAQETCHWRDVSQRYYRVVGDVGSEIQTISYADGYFAWANDETGGVGVVEATHSMAPTNWIRQEHHRFTDMVEFQMVQPVDPACVVQTGQDISYHANDDGDLQPGHSWPERFAIQADTNLVLDNLTGLMWTRNATAGAGTWSIAVTSSRIIERFGYADWRLPSVLELESLLDLGEFYPALPSLHPFSNLSTNYWTGTGDSQDTNKAWVIGMQDGTVARWARTNAAPAYWPVRTHTILVKAPVPKTGQTFSLLDGDDGHLQPGTPWPVPRFTVMADTNLVFDNLSGRMWTRRIGIDATTSWASALDHCTAMTLGNYTDWRLPTRREVLSLVDFGSLTLLPAGHPFTGTPSVPFWTSTSYRPLPATYAWGIDNGFFGPYLKTSIGGGVWPVRGNW